MAKQSGGKGGKKTGTKATSSTSTKPAATSAKTYPLGPQRDGSVVLRVESDFDLMVLRKAVEKQQKNAGAAVGTVSALADGEDPFIDAVQRSCERLLKRINTARAPENQIKDTPLGREMDRNRAETSGDRPVPQSDASDITWSKAVPEPRPTSADVVEFPGGGRAKITAVLGFVADGLSGDESDAELQKLADDGKLKDGAFQVIVEGRDENQTVRFHDTTTDKDEILRVWRVAGVDYNVAAEPQGNVGDAATSIVNDAKDPKKKGPKKRK